MELAPYPPVEVTNGGNTTGGDHTTSVVVYEEGSCGYSGAEGVEGEPGCAGSTGSPPDPNPPPYRNRMKNRIKKLDRRMRWFALLRENNSRRG